MIDSAEILLVAAAGVAVAIVWELAAWCWARDRGGWASAPEPPAGRCRRLQGYLGDPDVNVIVLAKGRERYIWFFRDDQVDAAACSAGRQAANPELSLTWSDARWITENMRKLAAEPKSNARRIDKT